VNHHVRRVVICTALASLPLMARSADALVDPPQASRHGWFLAAGVGSLELREPGAINDVLDYAYLQGGWHFSRYLSLDARVGTNALSVEYDFDNGQPDNLRVKQLYGLYARATLPVASKWELFALGGYTRLSLAADAGVAAVSDTTNSVSWGVGASWNFARGAAFDLEYLPSLTGGDGWHSSALNLGLRVQF
jgi:opacity protein-like surface antigen